MSDEDYVEVCNKCFRASCWQGKLYCENYKNAEVVKMTIEELRKMDLENPDYWMIRLLGDR